MSTRAVIPVLNVGVTINTPTINMVNNIAATPVDLAVTINTPTVPIMNPSPVLLAVTIVTPTVNLV